MCFVCFLLQFLRHSVSLPPGLSVIGATGAIEGTPTVQAKGAATDIRLEDDNSNVYIRRVVVRISSGDYSDRDRDGYSPVAGDTDDLDCRVNPGNPTYPTPENVILNGSSLSWDLTTDPGIFAYNIYSGDSPDSLTTQTFAGYTNFVDISSFGHRYFAVTAINHLGIESNHSSQVDYGPDGNRPRAPSGLRVTR